MPQRRRSAPCERTSRCRSLGQSAEIAKTLRDRPSRPPWPRFALAPRMSLRSSSKSAPTCGTRSRRLKPSAKAARWRFARGFARCLRRIGVQLAIEMRDPLLVESLLTAPFYLYWFAARHSRNPDRPRHRRDKWRAARDPRGSSAGLRRIERCRNGCRRRDHSRCWIVATGRRNHCGLNE